MEDDQRNTLYQDYTASCMGTLVTQIARMCGLDIEMPSYIELVYPKEVYQGKQPTAEEIKQSILARL